MSSACSTMSADLDVEADAPRQVADARDDAQHLVPVELAGERRPQVEADAAHALRVECLVVGLARVGIGAHHALEPPVRLGERVVHHPIVEAVDRRHDEDAALDADRLRHLQIMLDRRRGGRVEAARDEGKDLGRPHHVEMRVAGPRGRLKARRLGIGIRRKRHLQVGRHRMSP